MADLTQVELPNGVTYDIKDSTKLPLAGGTMSGQIKTSFNSAVATGSYGASAHTIPDLCEELRYSSGVMGSFDLTTSYTKDGVTIPTGWYNFLWIPHRSGGVNGQSSGDNCNYGSFIISGMTLSGAFLLRYTGSSINELKNIYNLPTSSDNITKGYLNIHPENNPTLIPFMNNDIAYLLKRGGSAVIKYDGVTKTYDPTNCFDASPSYFSVSSSTETTLTIELTLHRTFAWGNIIYIDFGNVNWRAKDVKFEVMNTSYTGDTWTEKFHTTTNSKGNCYLYITHTPVGASNAGGGFNKLRYTLTDWNGTDRRISQLGIYNYGSSGLRETFMPKDGGNIYGDIYPNANDGASLGTSNNKFFDVNTNRINGVSVGSSPKFTDTTYTFANGTNGFTVTPSGGSAQTVTVTPSIANNVTGSGTNGYIAKFNGGNTITNGPQLGSSTTTFLRNDGQWATPAAGSDVNVTQTATSTSANYEVLFSATADNTTRTEGARKNNNLTFNPSTGNLQATQLNGVAIGSSPKFTDNNTTYTFANGTNGFTVTPSGGSAQTVTVTPSITNNVTGSGTSGYLTKFNGANTITNGPQLGSSTTTFLSNAGTWLTPDGRGNKIFTTTPTTPYKVGDLYIEDDNNIYVCNTARSSGSYNSDDWGGAVAAIDNDTMENYVDGVLANAFGTNGGNVLWRLDANGKPYEFLVTDTPGNLNGKIWRWDGNGLRFSSSGYSGSYITLINSNGRFAADYLTGTFNANNLTIQNFSAAKISGGIFTRGNSNNNSGTIEVRDGSGVLIGEVNNAGFKFYGAGNVGSRPYFIFNNSVGFAGYNASGALTFQISTDEFHIQKLYADAQLTIGGYLKAVPVNNGTNKGISFVKAY